MTTEGPGQQIDQQAATNSLARWAGLIGVAGPVVFWVVSLALGFIWSGYSPIHNFVSTLSSVGAPYALLAQINLYIWGTSIIALALGLHAWSRTRRPWIGILLLTAVGVCVILAGVFQFNPDDPAAVSTRGHQIVTRVMMIATLLGLPLTTWRLSREGRWSAYGGRFATVATSVLLVASFAANMIAVGSGPTGWGGLGQRIFFAVITGWLAYHGLALYRLSQRG